MFSWKRAAVALALLNSLLPAQTQPAPSQEDAKAIKEAANAAKSVPADAGTIHSGAEAAKTIPEDAKTIHTGAAAAGGIPADASTIRNAAAEASQASKALNGSSQKVKNTADKLENQVDRFKQAMDKQSLRRDFVLAPEPATPGMAFVVDIICSDLVARGECLKQAGKVRLEVIRKTPPGKSWYTTRLAFGKPAACDAVESPGSLEASGGEAGLRARLRIQENNPAPTPAPSPVARRELGPVLTYCFQPPLNAGDKILLRDGIPDPEPIEVQDPAKPMAGGTGGGEPFDFEPEDLPESPFVADWFDDDAPAPLPVDVQPAKIASPKENETIKGADVPITAEAPAGSTVTAVEFWLDDKTQRTGDFTAASGLTFTYKFDTTMLKNGKHTLSTIARDKDGNASPKSSISVAVQNPVLDKIADLKVEVTSPTAATVAWTTDPAADAKITLTPTLSPKPPDDGEKKTKHSVSLTGLTPWTKYHFKVTSDDGRDPAVTAEVDFDTPALVLTAPHDGDTVSGIQTITATGTDKADVTTQFTISKQQANNTVDEDFESAVTGNKGTYTISWDTSKFPNGVTRINATAKDGTNHYQAKTITVKVRNLPVVSNVVVTVTGPRTASVSWVTDKGSDSQIVYGTDTSYKLQSALVAIPADSPTLHTILLANLDPSTTYHFLAKSKDAQGNAGASTDATFVTWATKPSKVDQLTEGTTKVVGYYNDGRADKVRVTVLDGNTRNQQQEQQERAVTDNKFQVDLTQPLSTEAQVIITGLNSEGKEGESQTFHVATSVMDWGRARASFAFGMVLSANEVTAGTSGNTNNAFSRNSASPFLGFEIDWNWLRPRTTAQRIRLNTYFDVRLTQIGAAAAGTEAGTSNSVAFLANKQAASLQGGVYLPVILARWYTKHGPHSFYVAPLAKVGLYTTSDDLGTPAGRLSRNTSFYNFHGFGTRIGHYQEYTRWNGDLNTDRAPEQLSYIDIMVGRWANFESVSPMTLSAGPPANDGKPTQYCNTFEPDITKGTCFLRQRLRRVAFEGVLQIPHTPLIIGMSANIGYVHPKQLNPEAAKQMSIPDAPRGYNFIQPPDDLRFLIGVRFNAKTLLAPLIKSVAGSVGQ